MKLLTPSRLALAIFTILYIVGATGYFMTIGNTEFLGYIAAVALLLVVIACTLHLTCFPDWLLWLLSFLMLLHILGGGIKVDGDVLYNYVVWPIENPFELAFIKTDQIVHTFGTGVAALFAYSFLRKYAFSAGGLFLFTVLSAMGIGAVNEVLEFGAKLMIPDTDVGGYYNTAMDLTVNMVGAIAGTMLGMRFWKRA